MLRSMYSAISGMNAFQTSLDVVGNNIANVDTTGFKASRAEFSDILSQTLSGASANANLGVGGMNPQQIGLGVNVSAVNTPFTQGADQQTGVGTDVALDGDGFFMVSNNIQSNLPVASTSASTTSNGTANDSVPVQTITVANGAPGGGAAPVFFTRAGDFSVDANGNLVLPDGSKLLGYLNNGSKTSTGVAGAAATSVSTDTSIPPNPSYLSPVNVGMMNSNGQVVPGQYTIGPDGTVTVVDPNNGNTIATWVVPIAKFFNPEGLMKSGNNLYQQTANSGAFGNTATVGVTPGGWTTPATVTSTNSNAVLGQPGTNGFAAFRVGALEASNVNLTNEFSSMIIAQQAFDANSKVINTDNNILSTVLGLENQA